MRFTGGKSLYDPSTGEWKSNPRVYSDFHCNYDEWKKLSRGRRNMVTQLLFNLAEKGYIEYAHFSEYDPETGLHLRKQNKERINFPLDLDGDSITEQESAKVIKYAIKLITGLETEVTFYSWKFNVDHVTIDFNYPNCKLPNVVVLFDQGFVTDIDEVDIIIKCINAIYQTINDLKNDKFNKYLKRYYNSEYDRVFNYTDRHTVYYSQYDYQWPDFYRLKANRSIGSGASLFYK